MSNKSKNKAPVTIDLEAEDLADQPEELVQPLPADEPAATSLQASAAVLGRSKPNRLLRWFLGVFVGFVTFVISIWAWNFINTLLITYPMLGLAAVVFLSVLVFLGLLILIRELAALARLGRVDRLQKAVSTAAANEDLTAARKAAADIVRFFKRRPYAQWGIAQFSQQADDILDADGVLNFAETSIITPMDTAALAHVEKTTRQVATVTALMPLALVDVISALVANVRMIRQIAETYGGRSGTLGSWRLMRSVLAHLVATGAVAIGDDMIGSVAGGSVLSKLSRRFGEGIINGALTARVGIAAMEVCRPMPFSAVEKPKVTTVLAKSVKGLFG